LTAAERKERRELKAIDIDIHLFPLDGNDGGNFPEGICHGNFASFHDLLEAFKFVISSFFTVVIS
jgi:hypothetical protein